RGLSAEMIPVAIVEDRAVLCPLVLVIELAPERPQVGVRWHQPVVVTDPGERCGVLPAALRKSPIRIAFDAPKEDRREPKMEKRLERDGKPPALTPLLIGADQHDERSVPNDLGPQEARDRKWKVVVGVTTAADRDDGAVHLYSTAVPKAVPSQSQSSRNSIVIEIAPARSHASHLQVLPWTSGPRNAVRIPGPAGACSFAPMSGQDTRVPCPFEVSVAMNLSHRKKHSGRTIRALTSPFLPLTGPKTTSQS